MAFLTFDKKRNPRATNISLIAVALLLIVFPFFASQFGNSWVRIMDMALLYIMLALGLNIVVGFAGLLGAILGAPTLKLRGDYLAIVTLGFGEIIRIFMNNLNAPVNITNGPQGINLIDPIRIFGVSLAGEPGSGSIVKFLGFSMPSVNAYYFLFLLLCIGVIFFSIRLQDSRLGRAWVAIREDEIAAKAMGINTRNVKL